MVLRTTEPKHLSSLLYDQNTRRRLKEENLEDFSELHVVRINMKRLCSAQGADRISYLPDPIQSHIVSFLPRKEAMRTAILSKGWGHICNSLYNMTFDQFEFEREKPRRAFDFRDFVDDLIFRHNRSDFLAWDRDLLPCLPSLPRSRKHLSLLMVPTQTHVGVVTLLLRSYSHLETPHIDFEDLEHAKVPAEFANEELYQQVKELPLAEILSCLRTVTVERYRGGVNELLILRYLLENAKFLEEMSIITDEDIVVNELVTGEILSISPRASPSVKISVS